MSQNTPSQVNTTVTSTPEQPKVEVTVPAPQQQDQSLVKNAYETTKEAIEKAKKEAREELQRELEEKNNKVKETEKQVESTDSELKQLSKNLENERAEKLEMRNFFLEKMLVSTIPADAFKKEDEYVAVKEKTKGFINKYNMGLEDADWLISTVAKGIPKPEDGTKKAANHGVGTAGLMYNPDNFLKTGSNSSTVPQPSSKSDFDDSDYPIRF
jgi:DNA repair ATPase RecN